MEGKLIKHGHSYALKIDEKLVAFAHPEDFSNNNIMGELSLTNCQAIERGYDLDELAKNTYRNFPTQVLGQQQPQWNEDKHATKKQKAYIKGFQKALEILGDKKFTEEDMIMFSEYVWRENTNRRFESVQNHLDNWKKPKQEWDVVIEMELIGECNGNNNDGCFMDSCGHDCGCFKKAPKLDQNGCLILKRKK